MIRPRALIVKIRFSLEGHHRFSENWVTPCNTASRVPLRSGQGMWFAGQRPQQPARLWNFLKSDRDAVLVVREPFGDRARAAVLVTAAMVASFGLGWAGGLNWPQFANELGLVAVAQKEAPSPQISEARSSRRAEGARKTASASGFARHCRKHSQAIRPVAGRCTPAASPVSQANAGPSAAAIAMRQPLVAAPETRPATIPGWTVVDVRDGTAVLEGPDGIRMAARGDTIPGLGRVESIVRWGSRWVIATAGGLIATQ